MSATERNHTRTKIGEERDMSLKDFHKQDLEETLAAFEKLQKRISKFWFPYIGRGGGAGICWLLDDTANVHMRQALFASWGHNSGSLVWPVQSPNKQLAPSDAFEHLPKWRGEYGRLRKQLLQHCIDSLKEEIEKRS